MENHVMLFTPPTFCFRHKRHVQTPLRFRKAKLFWPETRISCSHSTSPQRPTTLAYLWQHVLDLNFMLTLPLCRKGQNSCLLVATCTQQELHAHTPLCRKGQNACLRNELHALMLRLCFAVKPKRLSDTFAVCQLSLYLP